MLNSWKDHYWHSVTVSRARIEEIVRMVGTDAKKVLDAGCNEGFLSKALLESGHDVLSVDVDPEQIRKTEENFGIKAILGDINKLPFEDQHFDVVVAGEVLEHVFNPFACLGELFRLAKEKLIITIPIGEYWLGELTHQWELEGSMVEHDSGEISKFEKHALVLCWTRRRDKNFDDIPPFSTQELKNKYGIK